MNTGRTVPMPDRGLAGKRVVVTGAAGGLGRAFTQAFADAGAQVIAADIDADGAEVTARAIRDNGRCAGGRAGGRALAHGVDITRSASIEALAQFAVSSFGGIDILVNNAALYAGLERKPFEMIAEAEWDRVMAVNVKGPWLVTKAIAPHLRQAGGGAIVNISSATVMSGSPLWLHYVTSKGAIIAMTRALARELGDDRITVNAVAPGFTLTEASLGLIENAADYGVSRGALKRPADANDMVGAALFLASPHASFITGQTLIVDGGRQFL
jgi:NAD(P)-dependent dehydrogenase (short-subunit alcohol dehydrogenase family)